MTHPDDTRCQECWRCITVENHAEDCSIGTFWHGVAQGVDQERERIRPWKKLLIGSFILWGVNCAMVGWVAHGMVNG